MQLQDDYFAAYRSLKLTRDAGGGEFCPVAASLRDQTVFDFRAHFCHSAPMETHAFGLRLPVNASDGQKRFPVRSIFSFRGGYP
jgi:hypothetical protein